MGSLITTMFLILSTLAAVTTLSVAQLPFFFPRPQAMPVPSFPWMPFVGGLNSLPPWMRPPQGNNENTAEELPIVGGPDSLPPWLRPQDNTADKEGVSEGPPGWRTRLSPP